MIPLITGLVGSAVVIAGALVARSATRYSARLAAAQRARDAEIANLAQFRQAIVDAVEAAQAYVYYKDILGPTLTGQHRDKLIAEVVPQHQERVIRARETLRLIGYSQRRPEVQAVHATMHKLLEPLIAGRSDQWIQAMNQEPNPLALCMEIVGTAYGDLVDNYPTKPAN